MKMFQRVIMIHILLCLSLIPTIVFGSSFKIGIYALGATSPSALGWIKQKFDFISGGTDTPELRSGKHWVTYQDVYGVGGPKEYFEMKNYADSKGIIAEEMLLHAKQNYTSSVAIAWNQLDKFDAFEGKNGILRTIDNLTYTDLTSSAYSGDVTLNNTIYIGYEEAFAEANFTFSTFGLSVNSVWEYWNGSSWVNLTIADGTNNFTSNGKVSFVPPQAWTRRTVNSSRNKYFIRVRFSGAVTSPISSSIKGDDWLRGAKNLCRGWDPASATIVNPGTEIAYNPTPPANASAKFRYQSRIPFWTSNYFITNPADFQLIDGVNSRTWSAYFVKLVLDQAKAKPWTGIMCDDGQRDVVSDGISSALTDFADKTGNTWETEIISRYKNIVDGIHNVLPNFIVGINGMSKNLASQGDWNLAEYHAYVPYLGYPRNIIPTDSYLQAAMTYDDYLPSEGKSIVGMLIYADTASTAKYYDNYPISTTKVDYAWDRSNRGPILALTKHLIAANVNTYFSYFSRGGFYYSERDEVYLKNGSVVHLATDPVPDVSLVTRWGMYFPAMGVDFGEPDVTGYNGGARDFNWKTGAQIGGTQNVWRRDYTNAIVLHRTATWSTNVSEYSTYSTPISLDGTYYPLYADGRTGEGINSIALRAGEGAILMKVPIQPANSQSTPPIAPSPPINLLKSKVLK